MANGEAAPERRLSTGRLEAFSDGVFAVAITLLVLEITVPDGSEDDLLGAIADQWPSYLAYVASFSTIGAIWLAHSAITDYLHRANAVLIRLNLLLLLLVALIPFPSRLLAEHLGESDAARHAATVYGLTLLAVSVLVAVLWRYAVGTGLVRPWPVRFDCEQPLGATVRARPTPEASANGRGSESTNCWLGCVPLCRPNRGAREPALRRPPAMVARSAT
jgi:uncharacterized membrane protein